MLTMTSMATFCGLNAFFAKHSYERGHPRFAMLCSFATGALMTALIAMGMG